jgi:hypothetical protein
MKNTGALIRKSVGNNLDNEETDVRTIREVLKYLSVIDSQELDYQNKPLGIITRQLDHDIKVFQKDNGLREDGYIFPKGETEKQLLKRLSDKRHVEKEILPAPKPKNIPGTDIPDKGIPEDGRPGGLRFDPFGAKRKQYNQDPDIWIKPPVDVDENMKVYRDNIIKKSPLYEQDV